MSLETTIAGLVSASNALTDAVSKKISVIDAKVAAATEQVPATVRAEVSKILFVDSSSGSDTNTGLSGDKPLKTIGAAINKVMVGGSATINLRRGRVYEVTQSMGGNNVDKKSILFISWGAEAGRPIIRGTLTSWSSGTNIYICNAFMSVTEMTLKFSDCRIETGLLNGFTHYGSNYGGFFSRDGGSGESVGFKIFLHKCEVVVQDVPLFSTYFGFMQLSIAGSTITKGGVQARIVDSLIPKMIDVDSVSISGFGSGITLENLLSMTAGSCISRQSASTVTA